jgi:hypothetical protein
LTLLAVLVAFAVLLLFVGVVLLVAVVVLYLVMRRSEGAEGAVAVPSAPRPQPPPAKTPPPAPPVPAALAGNQGSAGLDSNLAGSFPVGEEDAEVAKTEVFSRGSLNLDWEDDDVVEGATEIFRSDEFELE